MMPKYSSWEIVNKIIEIDFYSSDCGTCKTMEPTFDNYSKDYKNAKFIKVNID